MINGELGRDRFLPPNDVDEEEEPTDENGDRLDDYPRSHPRHEDDDDLGGEGPNA